MQITSPTVLLAASGARPPNNPQNPQNPQNPHHPTVGALRAGRLGSASEREASQYASQAFYIAAKSAPGRDTGHGKRCPHKARRFEQPRCGQLHP
jgi:hypothetical protein